MDVELYIYDLSRGLARQLSLGLTGVQINAIYHTSLVFAGVEYFFGQGIHRKIPGSTHHGQPIEVMQLGKTELPIDIVGDYIDSLSRIYTTESYDLFLHNCNHFTQDLAVFLVGKDIPVQIRELPRRFLETPMGQMLRGQIDQSMRSMTQAPDVDLPLANGKQPITPNGVSSSNNPNNSLSRPPNNDKAGSVHNVTTVHEVEALLKSADESCAVIFFTSSTCPPCKIVYPAYDELAAEAGHRATLIKVDLNEAHAVGSKYQIRATPTFITFIRGEKENEWKGANEATLRGNVQLLIQMTWPRHPHVSLRLPTFQRRITEPVTFNRTPPLDKLAAKMGEFSKEIPVAAMLSYVKIREASGQVDSPLPNMYELAKTLTTKFDGVPSQSCFAVVDLMRVAAADVRVSAYLAAESGHPTILALLPSSRDNPITTYNLQVVTLQLACNLFTSSLFAEQLRDADGPSLLRTALENLASSSLLERHSNTRFLASALVYNMAIFDHNERLEGRPDKLNLSAMDSLEAALVEAVLNEGESRGTLHGLLLALGMLLYSADVNGSIWELCRVMDIRKALREKGRTPEFQQEPLLAEVGEELLGKGGST